MSRTAAMATAVVLTCILACGGLGTQSRSITLRGYNDVTIGMTYPEVKKAFGEGGKELSHGGEGEYETFVVSWENKDGSNTIVTFQNGRVINKAQAGLE